MAVDARVFDRAGATAAPATLSADAWQRFRRGRLAMVGVVGVALLVVAAAGAPWLSPAHPAKQSLIQQAPPPRRAWGAGRGWSGGSPGARGRPARWGPGPAACSSATRCATCCRR